MEFLKDQTTHKPWLSARVQQIQIDTQINQVAAATTLTSQTEDQTVNITSAAANYVITLPSLASCQGGQRFTFVLSATAGTNTVIITCPDGSKLIGSYLVTGGASPVVVDESAVKTNLIFGSTAVAGDRAQFFTNGSNWYWTGFCHASGALTLS